MTYLTDKQNTAIQVYSDWDMPLAEAQALSKSIARKEKESVRKRTVPNVFTTLSSRAIPRQGFLSTEMLRAIYLRSELVRTCVDTLIEIVAGLAWTIKPVDEDKSRWMEKKRPDEFKDQRRRIKWLKEFFLRPNEYENLNTFHRRLLRDLLVYDAGAYEVVVADYPDGGRLPLELGVVAGDTIEIQVDDAGLPIGYWQSYNSKHNIPFSRDEMAYLQLNPVSWSPYGLSPIESAYISITSDLNAHKYNCDFFSANGVPPSLLAVLGVSPAEYRSLMSQMRQTKADNPWNILTLRANRNPDGSAQKIFEMTPLTQVSNRDMQFAELLDHVTKRVCMAYKITPSMIGLTGEMTGGIGNGIADQQADLFKDKGVAPLLQSLEAAHTYNVIHCITGWDDLAFRFELSNTPAEQADYQRSVQELQLGVITPNEFRTKWGSRKSVPWGDNPLQQGQPPQQPGMGGMPGMGQPGGMPGQQPPGQPPQMPGMQPPDPSQNLQQPMQKSAEKRIVISF